MLLYHGTTADVARRALTEGLQPRGVLNKDSLWDCESRPDAVYLTAAYAGYFAAHASDDQPWGIIEVDTDKLPGTLIPDEDWLEQATRGQDVVDGTMEERTAVFRDCLLGFSHLWEHSVNGIGNCAHVGIIPPEAITRVTVYDPKQNPGVTLMAMDPCITLVNYQICGGKYQRLCKWLVERPVTDVELNPIEQAMEQARRQFGGPDIFDSTAGRTRLL